MEDLRLDLAIEICQEFGFQLFPGRCDKCACPLVERPADGLPFCWFCACDREAALRARTILLKVKLAAQGIIIHEDPHPHPLAEKQLEDESWHPLVF